MEYKEEKLHFWEFPDNLYINLKVDFRKKLFKDFCEKFNTDKEAAQYLFKRAKKYKSDNFYNFYSSIRKYKTMNKISIPIWIILDIAKLSKINLNTIESNIEVYGLSRGIMIENPVLPIRVTPEFDSILAHMLGDGTDRRNKYNSGDYCQYNEEGLNNFISKLRNVFGDLELNINEKKVGVPACIILILKKYFKMNDFGTHVSYLPKKLFYHSKYHKLAVILSFIVDEGTIYDTVSIRMANKKIIEDIKRLMSSINYICGPIRNITCGSGREGYKISFFNSDLKKLYYDIEELSTLFSTCTLAHKQESFNFLANYSRSCARKRYFGETKELIINLLDNKEYKTLELAKLLNISRRTTRIHLGELEKQNKVYLCGITNKGAKIWTHS